MILLLCTTSLFWVILICFLRVFQVFNNQNMKAVIGSSGASYQLGNPGLSMKCSNSPTARIFCANSPAQAVSTFRCAFHPIASRGDPLGATPAGYALRWAELSPPATFCQTRILQQSKGQCWSLMLWQASGPFSCPTASPNQSDIVSLNVLNVWHVHSEEKKKSGPWSL